MVRKVGELTWFERMAKEFENDPEYLREYIILCSDAIKCREEKITALERERDESRKWASAQAVLINKLEADSALLRKRLELATDFYWTWANDLPELDVMNKAIDFRKAMELKEGE